MTNNKINKLALDSKSGCKVSTARLIELFIPHILRESERIWWKVRDETAFEHECYRHILQTVKHYDQKLGNFKSLILVNIRRKRNEYVTRYKRELECTRITNEEGLELEFKDVLANVEQKVLLKEKVALLAEGDSRKLAILNAWIKGCYNDSEISGMLAHTFGGKPESHRKFIQRFRTKCQTTLADAV